MAELSLKAAGRLKRMSAAMASAVLFLLLFPVSYLYMFGIPLCGSWLILEMYPSIDGRLITALFFLQLLGWVYILFWHLEPMLDNKHRRSLEVVELEKEAGSHDKQKQVSHP